MQLNKNQPAQILSIPISPKLPMLYFAIPLGATLLKHLGLFFTFCQCGINILTIYRMFAKDSITKGIILVKFAADIR